MTVSLQLVETGGLTFNLFFFFFAYPGPLPSLCQIANFNVLCRYKPFALISFPILGFPPTASLELSALFKKW